MTQSVDTGPRMCLTEDGLHKRTYRSGKSAKRAVRQRMARGGRPMLAYRCQRCDWWHVGHDTRPKS